MNFAQTEAEAIRAKADEANNTPVKIALFGQPGAGKSSLINALIGEDKAEVSQTTDTTVEFNSYKWNNLELCDLPGYGTAKFPVETYFEKFKILTFDVFLCVSSGKFLEGDTLFYRELKVNKKPCIFVRNKSDTIYQRGTTTDVLKEQIVGDLHNFTGGTESVIFTSCRTGEGLDVLEIAISNILPEIKRDRFLRSAKAYSKEFLEKKRKACERYAVIAAGAAAATNLVPIPGVGFVADFAAIGSLLAVIRADFGLDVDKLTAFEQLFPTFGKTVQNVLSAISNQGVIWLLKRFGGSFATAQVAQFVPFVGQVIAASISFFTIRAAASYYIEECYKVAEKMLEERFGY